MSIDAGSWLVARELLLEREPPYHSFENRRGESSRLAYPVTADPRWVENAQARLRDVDDFRERRKRLTAAFGGKESNTNQVPLTAAEKKAAAAKREAWKKDQNNKKGGADPKKD